MNATNVTIAMMEEFIKQSADSGKAEKFFMQFNDVCTEWIKGQYLISIIIPILYVARIIMIDHVPEKWRIITIYGQTFWITRMLDTMLGICILYQTFYIFRWW